MEQKTLVKCLVNDFGYPEEKAQLIVKKLDSSQPKIKAAVDLWWNEAKIPTIEIAGYNFKRLVSEHNMNPVAAFLTLDWLLREPEEAIASLRKGHDYIA